MAGQLNELVEETLRVIRDSKGYVKATILPKLQDTSISLDERWDAYCKLVREDALPHASYGDGHIEQFFNVGPYDIYIERYQTTDYPSVLEAIEEEFDFKERVLDQEAVIKWKEKVLSEGYGAFRYDW